MNSYKLDIAYDGTNYHGFQKQKDKPTIQEKLEEACLLYTSPSPRDRQKSRMPSSA